MPAKDPIPSFTVPILETDQFGHPFYPFRLRYGFESPSLCGSRYRENIVAFESVALEAYRTPFLSKDGP
jgi:hypothetical protein